MKRSEAARARWARVVEAQARSGMSAAEFCRGRGIWASSFFAWKRKLGKSDAPAPGFVEAIVDGIGSEPHGGPYAGPHGGITIELAGGRRLTVSRGFDRQLLLDVIEALESCAQGDTFAQRGVLEHADGGTRGVR